MSVKRSAKPPLDRSATRPSRGLGSRRRRAPKVTLTVFRPPLRFRWAAAISETEWAIYRSAMEVLREAGIGFLLGGGFALAAYTGRWRDTKDIDFYIRPDDRAAAIDALAKAGFEDYFSRLPYDRKWIYRSVKGGVIVDIIWAMANQRAQVDESWFERAGPLSLRNQALLVVAPEEIIWCKLYILQRDHCDWTDIFNLLYVDGLQIDWDHLLARLEEDAFLLKALLTAYVWLCPAEAAELPESLWSRLDSLPLPAKGIQTRNPVRLLDSRAWFAGVPVEGNKLEV